MRLLPTRFFFFFMVIISSNSCSSKISHQKAIQYYFSVVGLVDNAIHETSDYMIDEVQLQQSIMNSKVKSISNNVPEPSNTEKKDSLKKRFEQFEKYLGTTLATLDTIIEIDKQINLKSKAVSYLNQTRKFHNQAFQKTLKIFEMDTLKITHEQNPTDTVSLEETKNDLDSYTFDFMQSTKQYRKKYRITERELKKYGL